MRNSLILLFLGLNYNVMNADVAKNEANTLHILASDAYKVQNVVIPLECSELLDQFADYASNFTKCSIKHARPITLCAECIEQYVSFHDKYGELMTKAVNGTLCKSFFTSQDRLDAVLEYHNSILSIWDKGHCSECFDWSNKEKPVLSNKYIGFKEKFNDTNECIKQNISPSGNNTDEVCQKCMASYVQLDEFYKSLSDDAIGVDSVCMDIVDSMNATRFKWSKLLNCCKLRRSPEIVFFCCTAIIGSLPLLFYIALRYCGPIKDLHNVLKQSRFKQMILRSSDGRIN